MIEGRPVPAEDADQDEPSNVDMDTHGEQDLGVAAPEH